MDDLNKLLLSIVLMVFLKRLLLVLLVVGLLGLAWWLLAR